MSKKNEKHFAELISRYEELRTSRGLSQAELKRVADWMQDIISVMSKHSLIAENEHGPRWEHIQNATLEMFRWSVTFEQRVGDENKQPPQRNHMYTSINFKTKKSLREHVSRYLAERQAMKRLENAHIPMANVKFKTLVEHVTLYAPGLGQLRENGIEFVEGPHYPAPHTRYAQVTVENGIVGKVK